MVDQNDPSHMPQCASGAKDTVAFDQAFSNGYLPDESSIEYEGLYNKYMFVRGIAIHIHGLAYRYRKLGKN